MSLSQTPPPPEGSRRRAVDRVPLDLIERLGTEPAASSTPLRSQLDAIEQLIPLILAAHGVVLLTYLEASSPQWVALVTAALSGVLGSALRLREDFARLARAILLLGISGFLLITTGGTASHFVLWLFILVSTYPFLITLRESFFYIPATCALYLTTWPIADPIEPTVVVFSRVALLLFLGLLMRQASRQLRAFGKMQRLATTDDLTGISNRRHFFRVAEREFERSRRFGTPLSAVLIDLDGFKQINDTYGHAAGDEALSEIARLLRAHARSVDTVARLGGDEFALLLPQTDASGGRVLVERLQRKVAGQRLETATGAFRVSFSVGIADLHDGADDVGDLLMQADASMYEDKRNGDAIAAPN